LSSESAKKELLENPGIKNIFLEEARRKEAERRLTPAPPSPPVKKQEPGFNL
jgi:hypothetical protein